MRLLSVDGRLWELTLLQASSDRWVKGHEEEINNAFMAQRNGCCRGIIRFKKGDMRAMAMATIEIVVHGLPHQHQYEVYYCKKGHYCIVQKERVFLHELYETTKEPTDAE